MNKKEVENNSMQCAKGSLLLSVDLEDARMHSIGSTRYRNRVPLMVEKFLSFFEAHRAKATFFVLGKTAAENTDLIKDIVKSGHEVASHSYSHTSLTLMTQEDFHLDLMKSLEILYKCGATQVYGFRSPRFSLTPKTPWVWEALAKAGLAYSSSILPCWGLKFCWSQFPDRPVNLDCGVWEIPISVSRAPMRFPFAGGMYFRVLPFSWLRFLCNQTMRKKIPITHYVHPHDIDVQQERYAVRRNPMVNSLFYLGRENFLRKLSWLCGVSSTSTYIDYVRKLEKQKVAC